MRKMVVMHPCIDLTNQLWLFSAKELKLKNYNNLPEENENGCSKKKQDVYHKPPNNILIEQLVQSLQSVRKGNQHLNCRCPLNSTNYEIKR